MTKLITMDLDEYNKIMFTHNKDLEILFKKLSIALEALDTAKYASDETIRKTVMKAFAKIDEIK